jgi:uncharacterized protein (DUF433 family)
VSKLDFEKHVEPYREEALLRGTDISVYRIAALYPHHSIDEILEDYPSLSRTQVASAVAYAEANPRPLIIYPATSLKRALGKLVDLGVFD